jgi:hypothetical protein
MTSRLKLVFVFNAYPKISFKALSSAERSIPMYWDKNGVSANTCIIVAWRRICSSDSGVNEPHYFLAWLLNYSV